MNLKQIIKETVIEVLSEINNIWYHGTPDNRDLMKSGSFIQKYGTTEIVSNPKLWNKTQEEMKIARSSGDEKRYFDLLNQVGKFTKSIKYKKPIFFTNNSSVARTYTDPHRANDYQNSEPDVINVEINDNGKILKIPAYGQRFRMIDSDIVKNGFIQAGIPKNVIENQYAMFPNDIRNNKMSAETIGIIAQNLGFDIVDVLGVLDSYHGGSTKSTVRMVFDPQRIKLLSPKDSNLD